MTPPKCLIIHVLFVFLQTDPNPRLMSVELSRYKLIPNGITQRDYKIFTTTFNTNICLEEIKTDTNTHKTHVICRRPLNYKKKSINLNLYNYSETLIPNTRHDKKRHKQFHTTKSNWKIYVELYFTVASLHHISRWYEFFMWEFLFLWRKKK